MTIAGISPLDGNATLANAGIAYIILERLERARVPAKTCARCLRGSTGRSPPSTRREHVVLPPPPIQGIGNAAGATMQVELRDGSSDLAKLQAAVDMLVANAATQRACSGCRPRSAPACRNTPSKSTG